MPNLQILIHSCPCGIDNDINPWGDFKSLVQIRFRDTEKKGSSWDGDIVKMLVSEDGSKILVLNDQKFKEACLNVVFNNSKSTFVEV